MARARNIKPGFFANDLLAEVSPLGRLLWIGLWTQADREGRLEDRPKRIKAQVLPYDECDVGALLDELQDNGFLERYSVDGNQYLQVVNWAKHQDPHYKEVKSTIPPPLKDESTLNQVRPKGDLSVLGQSPLIPDSLNLIPDSGFQSTASQCPPSEVLAPAAKVTPLDVAKKPPAPKAPPKPKPLTGPNGFLPEDIRPDFWAAWRLFPGDKATNATLGAQAFAAAVSSGQATGPELVGCTRRYRAIFTADRTQFMNQAHAWLANCGFAAFLEAERRGEPIKRAFKGRGEELTSDASGLSDYVMDEYTPAPRRVSGGL